MFIRVWYSVCTYKAFLLEEEMCITNSSHTFFEATVEFDAIKLFDCIDMLGP